MITICFYGKVFDFEINNVPVENGKFTKVVTLPSTINSTRVGIKLQCIVQSVTQLNNVFVNFNHNFPLFPGGGCWCNFQQCICQTDPFRIGSDQLSPSPLETTLVPLIFYVFHIQ